MNKLYGLYTMDNSLVKNLLNMMNKQYMYKKFNQIILVNNRNKKIFMFL